MPRPLPATSLCLAALLLAGSALLPGQGRARCGLVLAANPPGSALDHPDCDFNTTNPASIYAPTSLLSIPVVVHVIQATNGTGNLSTALVQSQIDVLNEDFRAMAGTAGAGGTDTLIEFRLASVDPFSQPTTGIVHYTDDTWFNDSGGYFNQIAWDTSRYLNIYTNNISGVLGFVPDLPQGGTVLGTNADRVVIHYEAFGRPALGAPPYDRGRTTTHEVGHYLGLFHTFHNGCGTASCYTTGDRICDTEAEATPHFGCPSGTSSCGTFDPVHNYMNYTDDFCMEKFTSEQTRRMRCTLAHYRPTLAQALGPVASAITRSGTGNLNSNLTASAPIIGEPASITATTLGTGYTEAIGYGFLAPASLPFQGSTILIDIGTGQVMFLPLQSNPFSVVWNWTVPLNNAFAGLQIYVQGALLGPTSFDFTNAVDLVVGF